MSIATAQLSYIFGLNAAIPGNVIFQDEHTVVYPAGAYCVMNNIFEKTQRFIPVSDKNNRMTAMTISPNHRYIALAEGGERATITMYDLHSLRRKRVLSCNEVAADEYVSLAFSPDIKCLVAQGGKPDWTLVLWVWEKGKVMTTMKIVNNMIPNSQVNQVSFHPTENTQLCVVGNGIFRCMRYTEGTLKAFGYQKMEPINYVCHSWLSENEIIVGTSASTLLILESGEIKEEIKLIGNVARGKSFSECITSLVAYSDGFACACGYGTVYQYERVDGVFKMKRKIMIPPEQHNLNLLDDSKTNVVINCLAISPAEEVFAATTDKGQLYYIAVSTLEGTGEIVYFEVMTQLFHSDVITDVDVCIRKPIAVSCSLDCSIRVWNYESRSLELQKVFSEEAFSIALHPSGLFLMVGFTEKLRLMNIFIDDIVVFKEFSIRSCSECAFSYGGHLFASVIGNVIQLFSTYTFKNTLNLKGHNAKVKSVIWSFDDNKLVTCGLDGAVYEWDPITGRRIGDSVLRTCSYSSITITPDGKSTLAVGSDRILREISDSRVLRELPTGDMEFTTLAMSRSGLMLFAGTMKGTLLSVKYPLTVTGDWIEYQGHDAAIVKIKISSDDSFLISVAEDATVNLWKLHDREGHVTRDPEFTWAEEMLISKKDLLEKNIALSELSTKIEEIRKESQYHLQQRDINFNEKITTLTETFITKMERLKTKNQIMQHEKDCAEKEHEETMETLISIHTAEKESTEDSNNQKMVQEFEKFQELQAKIVTMQEEYEKQLADIENNKEKALEALTDYYETKLQEITAKLGSCNSQIRQETKDHQEIVKQIEEDCDREIQDIKQTYAQKLHQEKVKKVSLKETNAVLMKRFTSLQKEIDELKDEIKKLKAEAMRINNANHSLEIDIATLKSNISDRDINIQKMEADIFTLKRKNNELEKFRFVLSYKIKELREQIEPREIDIKKMKEQIHGMEMELGRFHKQNGQHEFTIAELKQKLRAADREMHREKQKVHDVEAIVRKFKTELHNCIGNIQDTKLFKEGIRLLYRKHVLEDSAQISSVDADIQKEFSRQKEHLERSVAVLRKKLEKDSEIHKADTVKVMQENVALIKDICDLRKELKLCRELIHDMSAAITLESHQKKAKAPGSRKYMGPLMEKEMEEQKKIIEMQQLEMKRLRDEIYDLEVAQKSRRPEHLTSLVL
ncbi:hypothetical protein BsWGS_02803 [Bradybaena similaris]